MRRPRKLVDRLWSPIVTWLTWGQAARAVEGDQHRGPLLQDRPSWGAAQQHVFRLDILDADQCNLVVQLISDSRRQLVGATSATTSSSTVVEPASA